MSELRTSAICARLIREASLLDAFGPTQMGETLRQAAAILMEYEAVLKDSGNMVISTYRKYA